MTTGARLADGTAIEVRPIDPGDADRLRRFHSRLSTDTTYLRFFSPHPTLSDREVERFTNVDHTERDALVAICDDEIAAVGRYDRTPGTSEAEVAFVVEDRWQGRGIGTVLMERLAALARSRGITTLVADTMPHNQRMLTVFRHARLPITERLVDGIVHVTLEL